MWMEDKEIIRSYKKAEKKAAQVEILSQLNAVPKSDIYEILRQAGIEIILQKPNQKEKNK